MKKENIEPPEPGELPPRISFVEQMGGSAGYYVRFKDLSEEAGGPLRKYIPILQFESQEEALQDAINFRDRKAEELGLPKEPSRGPHGEGAREKMSAAHNRMGLQGLGLTLSNSGGTINPVLRAPGAHTLQERGGWAAAGESKHDTSRPLRHDGRVGWTAQNARPSRYTRGEAPPRRR